MQISPLSPTPLGKNDNKRIWRGDDNLASALAIFHSARQYSGLTLVLCSDANQAILLEQSLSYLGKANLDVLLFPDRETLPYDVFSPHQDIISTRLKTLATLPSMKKGIVIVPVNTAMVKLAPTHFIKGQLFNIKVGDTLSFDAIKQQLTEAGYRNVEQVFEHGEFAVRGSIIDIYPMAADYPFRIELFDEEIESIRHFDVDSQRSGDTIDAIELLPASEFPTDAAAVERFRLNYRERFERISQDSTSIYQQVSRRIFPSGIEHYLPLFCEHTDTLFDYLHADTQLFTLGDIEHHCRRHFDDIEARYDNLNVDNTRPLLPPIELYLPAEQLFTQLAKFPRTSLLGNTAKAHGHLEGKPISNIEVDHTKNQPLDGLIAFCKEVKKVILCVESPGRQEALLALTSQTPLKPVKKPHLHQALADNDPLSVIIAPLSHGIILPSEKVAIVCETELFGAKISQTRRRNKQQTLSADALIKNLAELSSGQPVVHMNHGVGLYQGLERLDTGGFESEFLKLEYHGGDLIYVPVTSLHLISRYSGSQYEQIKLNKLGSKVWEKARKVAAEKIRDVAAELLDVYAQREAQKGESVAIDDGDYRRFCADFPFEETADQELAIDNVLNDLKKSQPMDRLVCGDVGFGKTEVAMRAAFAVANAGKQVAILVPTTLLANQHFQNISDRFSEWPIKVELMSRSLSAKAQKKLLSELEAGTVDIVVGTHKLLGDGIKFNDLGLLVVDEEHRFGVRQKEQIKRLRANVDILTMTATPIPRTLNMAMSGMRDLSIIATPPAKRLSIKTFVHERNNDLIREAILREILRGGQCYFLHNNVETIEHCARSLEELIPEAKVGIGHGQMRERDLEQVMSDFYHQRFNVLVCSTIVETGIDVPSANTIIIDRADKFGLAQLHQLRGRVGRSHHQAYAYLLTPHPKALSSDASKRLEAISQLQDLGAGFLLATQDLEIRGAGELLGDEQSGHINKIGFSLYMEMLEEAVAALKEGKTPSLDAALKQGCEVELRIPALLPDDYIRDVNLRLSTYKRLASCQSPNQISELKVEMIDRFGLLPSSAATLFGVASAKLRATRLGIDRLEMNDKMVKVSFGQATTVNFEYLIDLVTKQSNIYQLDGPTKLNCKAPSDNAQSRLQIIDNLLTQFEQNRV